MPTTKILQNIMTRDVVTTSVGATVHEALDLMISDRVSCLPALSASGKCVGMLSLQDLMGLASESEHMLSEVGEDAFDRMWIVDVVRSQFGEDRVEALMSDPPIRIDLESTIEESAGLMLQHNIHHLPVIDGSERLVGLVSSMDLLRTITCTPQPA